MSSAWRHCVVPFSTSPPGFSPSSLCSRADRTAATFDTFGCGAVEARAPDTPEASYGSQSTDGGQCQLSQRLADDARVVLGDVDIVHDAERGLLARSPMQPIDRTYRCGDQSRSPSSALAYMNRMRVRDFAIPTTVEHDGNQLAQKYAPPGDHRFSHLRTENSRDKQYRRTRAAAMLTTTLRQPARHHAAITGPRTARLRR